MKRFRLVLSIVIAVMAVGALCGQGVAQPPRKPLGYLLKHVGSEPYDLWKTEPLHKRLETLLGRVEYQAFVDNLDPAIPLTESNGVLYVTGNAPHRGTEEEAVMLVDVDKDTIEVFLLHKSSIVRGWAENDRLVAIPKDVQETMNHWPKAALLQTLGAMRQNAAKVRSGAGSGGDAKAQPAAAFTPSARVCDGAAFCEEVNNFAATITDFRTSVDDRHRIVTATVRFTNKLNRPLTLGLVRDSGLALDDQGNRYTVYGESNVRGIGVIVNNTFDPKFSLQPGESADARIEFLLATAHNVIYGTSWETSFTVREIDPAGVGQYRMGRESELRFAGLANRVAGAPVGGSVAGSGGGGRDHAASSVAGGGGAAPAARQPDACGGAPRCYSTALYAATINSFTSASVGNFHDHVLRFQIQFRNVTGRPIILAYGAGTSSVVDNLGNQYYWGHAGGHDGSVQAMGISEGQKADPQFVLRPGESRNAVFQVIRYRPGQAQIGTSFTYSVTIKQLEILPSQQIRELRDFSMTYPDLTPTGGGLGTVNPQSVNDSIRKLGSIFGK